MKRLTITLTVLLACVCSMFAKDDKVNYELMKNVSTINYSFDYSAFKISKIKAKDFVDMKLNMDYDKFTGVIENILIENANENMSSSKLILSNEQPSDVEIKGMPISADDDGENTIMFKLVYKPTDTLITSFKLNTNGGDNDRFQEEFMKSLSKTGKKLGKQLSTIKAKSNSTK